MSSNFLVEETVDLIKAKIKSDIQAFLTAVKTDRADSLVTMEAPRAYFEYSSATTYRCPAVFIVPTTVDFDKDLGANHINAVVKIRLAIIVEDKDLRLLNIKAWRYQAAVHRILNQTTLVSSDSKLRVTTIVRGATFSPEFTLAQKSDMTQGAFQKEVALDIDCRHIESF